jgi:hypothetical protein
MNAEHLNIIRTHFKNPYPFWVDERDEDGCFPASPTPEAEANPVNVIDGKVVPVNLEMTVNDKPITDAMYVAYI